MWRVSKLSVQTRALSQPDGSRGEKTCIMETAPPPFFCPSGWIDFLQTPASPSQWLMWQSILVTPFLATTRRGDPQWKACVWVSRTDEGNSMFISLEFYFWTFIMFINSSRGSGILSLNLELLSILKTRKLKLLDTSVQTCHPRWSDHYLWDCGSVDSIQHLSCAIHWWKHLSANICPRGRAKSFMI